MADEGEIEKKLSLPKLEREKIVKVAKFLTRNLPKEYLDTQRLTVLYFVVSTLEICDDFEGVDKEAIIEWVYAQQCQPSSDDYTDEEANFGFRGCPFIGQKFDPNNTLDQEPNKYDLPHISMTYTALCILLTLGDNLERVNRKAIIRSLKRLQRENGAFSSSFDHSECDMRFLYCACAISYILDDWSGVDQDLAVKYIKESAGYEFGFGQGPGQESHGGSTYCAIASLALMGRLDEIGFYGLTMEDSVGYNKHPKIDDYGKKLLHWLINKQVSGFCGRTNKYQDSCYSWWVGSSLQILGFFDFVDKIHLKGFLMACQDSSGGFGRSPDAKQDFLHTYFSLCGLSFLDVEDLQKVHCSLGISLRASERLKEIKKNFQ